ncbi:MAG: sulfotransferase [Chloroflexi bacterium]|nr:sulfotransferase [Chloroflexota bacterium]
MTAMLDRPIFVVGCPRSGTTLVQCILSASSQAFSLPETHFFSYVLPELGIASDTPLSPDALRQARALLEGEADLPDLGEFWNHIESPITALDLFTRIVEHFRPAAGLRAIEKTPLHVMCLDLIGSLFPDASFVNVVRDPVDTVSSLLGVPWAASRSVLSNAQRWTDAVLGAEAFARVQPRRIRTVVYEHLVSHPEPETRALCEFVNIQFEPSMLEEFGAQARRNVGRSETWKRDVGRGVLLNRSGVWRSRLTPGQAWLVAQATGPLRREYGYVQGASARPGSIARAMLDEAQVRFEEARGTGLLGAARHAGTVLRAVTAT